MASGLKFADLGDNRRYLSGDSPLADAVFRNAVEVWTAADPRDDREGEIRHEWTDMNEGWWGLTWGEAVGVVGSLVVVYLAIIAYARIAGLRSFSKMSASDFAMTVAVGSLFASAISSPDPSLGVALLALAGLFFGQWLLARARRWSKRVRHTLDNDPIVLMRDGELLHANLARSNVSEADVRAKLREANVLHRRQVRAVVLETTGDVSVLHSEDDETELEPYLLEGVRT